MDELREAWSSLKNEADFSEGEILNIINRKPKGTMQTLRVKVLRKFYWTAFFTMALGMVAAFAEPLASQILLLIVFSAYLIGSILFFQEQAELKKEIDLSQNSIDTIIKFRDRIRKVIFYEQLIGLVLYPISVSAGFTMGFSVGSDGESLAEPQDWMALIGLMIVITPIAHWLTKRYNARCFNNYLKRLEDHIEALQTR